MYGILDGKCTGRNDFHIKIFLVKGKSGRLLVVLSPSKSLDFVVLRENLSYLFLKKAYLSYLCDPKSRRAYLRSFRNDLTGSRIVSKISPNSWFQLVLFFLIFHTSVFLITKKPCSYKQSRESWFFTT